VGNFLTRLVTISFYEEKWTTWTDVQLLTWYAAACEHQLTT